jgi:hypothetical protein
METALAITRRRLGDHHGGQRSNITGFVAIAESQREATLQAWEACKPAGVTVTCRPEHGTAQIVTAKCLL